MSIYRNPYVRPSSDVHADKKTDGKKAASPETPAQKPAAPQETKQLRRASPADTLFPHTLNWVASLPPNVRPPGLLRQYARIANLIAATWLDTTSFEAYIDSLLTDKRGNRKGFPPAVLAELTALKRYRETCKDDVSVWHTVGKRG